MEKQKPDRIYQDIEGTAGISAQDAWYKRSRTPVPPRQKFGWAVRVPRGRRVERVKHIGSLRHAREEIAVAYHDRLVCWMRIGEVLDREGIGIVGCT